MDGKYCGKALHVTAGHALSLQYHEEKDETISVQWGLLSFEVGHEVGALEEFELHPGESVRLEPGTIHRMTALVDSVVLEASPPSWMMLSVWTTVMGGGSAALPGA